MELAPIAVVILAAGQSRRLRRPKQLVLLDGEPLVHRAARIALDAGIGRVRVVLGACAEEVMAALGSLPVKCAFNQEWESGMASSIRVGVNGLSCPTLLMTCDQPGVTAEHLRALAAAHQASPETIVASAYAGAIGTPALFPAKRLDQLRALQGDRGARGLLQGERVQALPLPGGELDVDTVEDLERLARR